MYLYVCICLFRKLILTIIRSFTYVYLCIFDFTCLSQRNSICVGFIIHSSKYGNTVEISNIGRGAVFVNDYGGDGDMNEDRTVTGTLKSNSITCSVELMYNKDYGQHIVGSSVVPLSRGKKGAMFQTDCSIAAFGATAPMATALLETQIRLEEENKGHQQDTNGGKKFNDIQILHDDSSFIHVRAPLYYPTDDPSGCLGASIQPASTAASTETENMYTPQDSSASETTTSTTIADEQQQSSTNQADQSTVDTKPRAQDNDISKDDWLLPLTWLKTNAMNMLRSVATAPHFSGPGLGLNSEHGYESSTTGIDGNENNDDLHNGHVLADRIVMTTRGQCLFEDKAFNAQSKAGAIGHIVVNNEETKFVMAGSSTVENLVRSTSSVSSTITIPSVMISKRDGQILKSTVDHLRIK